MPRREQEQVSSSNATSALDAVQQDSGDARSAVGVPPARDILHLAELVPVVRARFAVQPAISDDAILASLHTIAAHSDNRVRWRTAFNSDLGATLAREGRDLNTALNTLLALLPRPLS